MGNNAPDGLTLVTPGSVSNLINFLKHAQLFIGIGSGLSWLSWASGCQTCLISGFSYPYTEIDAVIRISPSVDSCSGCFNRYPLNASDWDWCPDHQGTSRHYECTKSISAEQVIAAIAPVLI
jgi:autotransporter strand-loop-strand O-heptosyltransferase